MLKQACCLYRLVQTAQWEEMEPAAAMAHTRLAGSSIPEPEWGGSTEGCERQNRKNLQGARERGRDLGEGKGGEGRWVD